MTVFWYLREQELEQMHTLGRSLHALKPGTVQHFTQANQDLLLVFAVGGDFEQQIIDHKVNLGFDHLDVA
jgi:hypothetical protein